MSRRLFTLFILIAAFVVALRPGIVRAQTAPQTAGPAPSGPVAGWQNGFFIQSPNGDNRLQIGLTAQFDGRFSLSEVKPTANTFTIRKARPAFSGRIAKHFDFRFMPEFGGGTALLLDAYLDLRFSSKFRVRSGKAKTPVGYEFMVSDAAVLLPERALPSNLVPARDVGVQALGDLAGGRVTYAGGVFNGVLDATNSTDVDLNNGKDLAGNVVIQPFISAATHASAIRGLGFHLGGSTGNQVGALPTYRTSLAAQTFFAYAGATSTTAAAQADGRRNRVVPAVFYYYRSFGAFAEYSLATQAVRRGTTSEHITNHGWGATGSWLVTGETASAAVPTPTRGFDPPAGHWGALEVVARYAAFAVDQAAFDAGLAAAGASRTAESVTFGANWYPVQYVKYYLAYEHTSFEGPTPRAPENTLLFRVQLAF